MVNALTLTTSHGFLLLIPYYYENLFLPKTAGKISGTDTVQKNL